MEANLQTDPLPRLDSDAAAFQVDHGGDVDLGESGWFGRLLAWDEATLLAARRWRSPGRTLAARALTRLGDASG
jgi:hypothetical protein